MSYLNFEEYSQLGGTTIPRDEFDKVARAITRKIDTLTYNRIRKIKFENLTDFQKEIIKEAMVNLCDFEYDNDDILNGAISSYSINGVSVGLGNSQGGITVNGTMVSRNGYELLKQTGLTCALI